MAIVNATAQPLTMSAVTPTVITPTTDGVSIAVGSVTALVVRVINGAGAPITVVIDDPTTAGPDGATAFNPDVTLTVAASSTRIITISDLARFRSAGKVLLTPSAVTTVTMEAYSV